MDSESTDKTKEILAAWKVEVVSEPAGNVYAAIIKGLAAVGGT